MERNGEERMLLLHPVPGVEDTESCIARLLVD